METYKQNLTDGVTFTSVKTNKCKYDLLTINFFLPLTRENAVFAALLASVTGRGTVKYPTMRELAIAQEELYSANAEVYHRVMGESVCVTYSLSYINREYTMEKEDITDKLFYLLTQLMFNPLTKDKEFLSEYVESEKKNQIDIIRSRTDNKSSYAVSRCVELMCEGEAYSVHAEGKEEDVNKINGKNLYEFYINMLTSAPAHIVFSGNTDGKLIADKICSMIPPFQFTRQPMPVTQVRAKAENVREYTEKMDITQSKLSIGYRTGVSLREADWLKFLVFDEIFAASPSSKLFANVREKMSLCYYCSPVLQSIKGMLIITSGIESGDRDKTYKAINEQLDEMRNGNFTDEELSTAIRSVKSSFRSVTDSVKALNSYYLSRFVVGLDLSPQQSEEMLDKVTRQDVILCAKRLSEDTVYFLEGGGCE